MSLHSSDTVAAPITGPGLGAVSVVRVSGARVLEILPILTPKSSQVIEHPRTLVYAPILDIYDLSTKPVGTEQTVLDRGLIVYFPSGASFTGEDVIEIHLHGGPYLQSRLLAGLTRHGARLARPGEFSERAYHNGKIDLTQAEAIADLIGAETQAQAQAAREQLEGALAHAIEKLREPIRNLLSEIEARIDFPEEGIESSVTSRWVDELSAVELQIEQYLETFSSGRRIREGARVVLAGLPNAGKSSLLNRLLGENRAIVTAIPGTTRDTIEERIELDGLLIRLLDTAGLEGVGREVDEVERLGIERSWKAIERADLVLLLRDITARSDEAEEQLEVAITKRAGRVLVIYNKSDLLSGDNRADELNPRHKLVISALTGAGIKELLAAVSDELVCSQQGSVLITNQRHFEALKLAHSTIVEGLARLQTGIESEIIAVHLREALSALEEIVGVTTTEDILGLVFSKFCIGK